MSRRTVGPRSRRPSPYATQARLLESMVRTVHRYRGTFGVTDYRWFNLRDGDTSSPPLFQHVGLLESDYEPQARVLGLSPPGAEARAVDG